MFSLSWVLVGWLLAVGLFAILALLTVAIHLKYAVSSFTTYAMTALFLGVTILTLFFAMSYIATVDWSQSTDLMPSFNPARVIEY